MAPLEERKQSIKYDNDQSMTRERKGSFQKIKDFIFGSKITVTPEEEWHPLSKHLESLSLDEPAKKYPRKLSVINGLVREIGPETLEHEPPSPANPERNYRRKVSVVNGVIKEGESETRAPEEEPEPGNMSGKYSLHYYC